MVAHSTRDGWLSSCVPALRAGPAGIPKHVLASRMGMPSKRAVKVLAEFSKRHGVLETNEQQGRMQMKVHPVSCCQRTLSFGTAQHSLHGVIRFSPSHPCHEGALRILGFRSGIFLHCK